jgi:hypothetical protein
MSGTDMNDPHVEKLTYRVIIPEYTNYNNAPPTSGETGDFNWLLNEDQLVIQMKTHCATKNEAREIVDEYLKAWEVTAGLLHQPDSLAFKFSSALTLNRPPGDENSPNKAIELGLSETILLSDEAQAHVSYDQFPVPHQNFKASQEVEMMFFRYKMYREGRESLLGMAYWCLTVMEYAAGGRSEAADQYRVDHRVLRKLGELCGNRGDIRDARKLKGNAGIIPLKPAEREWIRAVVKKLILRVGEYAYDPVSKLSMITMSDFPSTS